MNQFRIFFLLVFGLFLMAGIPTATSQGVHFRDLSWDQALSAGRSENKYIFVDAYTDWCGWCKVMDKKTFSDPEVAHVMEKSFIPVKIEMETGFGIDLARKFQVSGFPTFLVFTPEGRLVYRMVGFQEKKPFTENLAKSLISANQIKAPGRSSQIAMKFPDFYARCFGKGKKDFPDEQEVTAFLNSQTDLFSEEVWAVMVRFGPGESHREFFLQHRADYLEKFENEQVNEIMDRILYDELGKCITTKDEKCLENLKKMVDQYGHGDKALNQAWYASQFYRETGHYASMVESVKTMMALPNFDQYGFLNELAWELYEKCENQGILSKATQIMEVVVEKDGQYAHLDTYAALLFKTGNRAKAQEWAEKAITQGRKDGEKVEGTEDLLKKIKASN